MMHDPTHPIRTCVGCRQRDAQARLLRVAAADGHVVADPRRRLPGRGAYVHYGLECVDRGARRGGIARGLRMALPPADVAGLRAAVSASGGSRRPAPPSEK